jgi:hypothetical protein
MVYRDWVRLPTAWVRQGNLKQLRWANGEGANNVAALMALVALAHNADDNGVAELTYDRLCEATDLSREKLANGLNILTNLGVITRKPAGRSSYQLTNYNPEIGWAKLPAKSMYSGRRITAFYHFKLRRTAELDALKAYLLFVAGRDRRENVAKLGYDKIQQYTGIERGRIKAATSFLASLPLIYVEQLEGKHGPVNGYRIVGLDSYNHAGNKRRVSTQSVFDPTSDSDLIGPSVETIVDYSKLL